MIAGEKINLVALEPEHLAAANKWVNDPDLRRFISLYIPAAKKDTRAWYDAMLADHTHHVFAIMTKRGKHIGNIGVHDIDWKNSNAEIGIIIGEKDNIGRGYGEDAVRTLCRFAFDELNLNRLRLNVFAFNKRATACYEKCGFKQEGMLREAEFTEGGYLDVLVMGILAREFSAMEAKCAKG